MLLTTIFKQKEIYKETTKCLGFKEQLKIGDNFYHIVIYIPHKLIKILNDRVCVYMKPEYKFFGYDFDNAKKFELTFQDLIPIFRELKEIKEFNKVNNLNIDIESLLN